MILIAGAGRYLMARRNSLGSGTIPQDSGHDKHPEGLPKDEVLLRHEFDAAWSHYRQNENLRSQYLGYFFVLAVGSAAFGAQTVTSHTLKSPLGVVLLGLSMLAFALLTGFVYLGVHRAGIALIHYESVWNHIRDHFYADIDRQRYPYRSLNIRSAYGETPMPGWTRMQSSGEIVIIFFSLVAAAVEVLLTLHLFSLSNATLAEHIISVAMLAITLSISLALPFLLRSGIRRRLSRN